MAKKGLTDMAKEMSRQDLEMRKAFQDKTVETRDAIRSTLADPLYIANMERWGDAPWRHIDTGGTNLPDTGDLNLGGTNLDDLISEIGTWEPNPDVDVPRRDWTVQPDSSYYDPTNKRGLVPDYFGSY